MVTGVFFAFSFNTVSSVFTLIAFPFLSGFGSLDSATKCCSSSSLERLRFILLEPHLGLLFVLVVLRRVFLHICHQLNPTSLPSLERLLPNQSRKELSPLLLQLHLQNLHHCHYHFHCYHYHSFWFRFIFHRMTIFLSIQQDPPS